MLPTNPSIRVSSYQYFDRLHCRRQTVDGIRQHTVAGAAGVDRTAVRIAVSPAVSVYRSIRTDCTYHNVSRYRSVCGSRIVSAIRINCRYRSGSYSSSRLSESIYRSIRCLLLLYRFVMTSSSTSCGCVAGHCLEYLPAKISILWLGTACWSMQGSIGASVVPKVPMLTHFHRRSQSAMETPQHSTAVLVAPLSSHNLVVDFL